MQLLSLSLLSFFVVLFCVCTHGEEIGVGGWKQQKFPLESRFLLLTDRCGTMKANHNVPHTSKVPVFLHLLATTRNNLSPDVDSSKNREVGGGGSSTKQRQMTKKQPSKQLEGVEGGGGGAK